MSCVVNGFTRSVSFEPAYDKRSSEPGKNYGVHGVDMYFWLAKDGKGISFTLFTGWQLPHVAKEQESKRNYSQALPALIAAHSSVPIEDQEPKTGCCIVGEGNPCYDHGSSGLTANEAFDALTTGGEEGLWKFMEGIYERWLNHE